MAINGALELTTHEISASWTGCFQWCLNELCRQVLLVGVRLMALLSDTSHRCATPNTNFFPRSRHHGLLTETLGLCHLSYNVHARIKQPVASSDRQNQHLHAHFTLETLTEQGKQSGYEEMISRLGNIPIQDPALDGATYDELRVHFASWLQTQDKQDESGDRDLPHAHFSTFLVINQASLEKIANAPDPADEGVAPSAVTRPCLIAGRTSFAAYKIR
jgi:hypothetical protein